MFVNLTILNSVKHIYSKSERKQETEKSKPPRNHALKNINKVQMLMGEQDKTSNQLAEGNSQHFIPLQAPVFYLGIEFGEIRKLRSLK